MAFFTDPTDVPAATPRKLGGWKYKYGRVPSGDWLVKRNWQGPREPGMSFRTRASARKLPASWDPTANQFPFMQREGITSDAQRAAADQLGFGGLRPLRGMRKPSGSYFNPAVGFEENMQPVSNSIRISGGGSSIKRAGFPSTLSQLSRFAPRATRQTIPNWMLPTTGANF